MGRGLVEFEEMQQAYLAIKDIDKVIDGDSTTKLEDAWNVISGVSKDKFDEDNINHILFCLRDSLLKIYKQKEEALDNSINRSEVKKND